MTEKYKLHNEVVLANYKFIHEDGNANKMKVLIVEAKLTELINENMKKDEKMLILENAMRVLLAMVPDDES